MNLMHSVVPAQIENPNGVNSSCLVENLESLAVLMIKEIDQLVCLSRLSSGEAFGTDHQMVAIEYIAEQKPSFPF